MQKANLIELVPRRNAVEIGREDGRARVEFPRFKSRLGQLFGKVFGASNTIKLTLDEKCTAVWDLIDGKTSVGLIGDQLLVTYGSDIEPLYERLSALLATLESNKMIRYSD